jgi:hypothetical protein
MVRFIPRGAGLYRRQTDAPQSGQNLRVLVCDGGFLFEQLRMDVRLPGQCAVAVNTPLSHGHAFPLKTVARPCDVAQGLRSSW